MGKVMTVIFAERCIRMEACVAHCVCLLKLFKSNDFVGQILTPADEATKGRILEGGEF